MLGNVLRSLLFFPLAKAVSTKSSASKSHHDCPICEEVILDESRSHKAQDSIFWDGVCQAWLHGCGGLSISWFIELEDSHEPFKCVSCCLSVHSREILVSQLKK